MNLKQIIGEELFNQLPEEKKKEYAKQDLQDVSEGKYVPKDRFDQVNQQSKDYKEQVSERDRQIESLKNEFKDVDGLKDKVEQFIKEKNLDIAPEYGVYPSRRYDSPAIWGDATLINKIMKS